MGHIRSEQHTPGNGHISSQHYPRVTDEDPEHDVNGPISNRSLYLHNLQTNVHLPNKDPSPQGHHTSAQRYHASRSHLSNMILFCPTRNYHNKSDAFHHLRGNYLFCGTYQVTLATMNPILNIFTGSPPTWGDTTQFRLPLYYQQFLSM